MAKFKDAVGQEWRIEFDGFLLDQIEKEARVDLADLSAGGLLAIVQDAKALVRVLVVACDEQLKELRKPAKEFQNQIRKDAITRAREAVLEALADFFPQSEWSAMQSNLTKRKNQPAMAPEQIQLAAGFLRMDPQVQRDVMNLIREESGGLGNLFSLPGSESVPGQDDAQLMPASDSQENATSIQDIAPSVNSG